MTILLHGRSGHTIVMSGLTIYLLFILASCSSTAAANQRPTATANQRPTATASPPPPCNTHATTTATVWDEDQQIHGGIGGAAPTQLSTFSYPLGLPDEGFDGNQAVPGFLAVSPDGAHIGVDVNVFVPFTEEIYPYVVDTTTHTVTRVILPAYPRTPDEEPRLLAWADSHTLVVFTGSTNGSGSPTSTYTYDITTHTTTALPGVTNGVEGVMRCSTLYWMDTGAFTALSPADPNHTSTAPERIHRYDLTSHAEIGSPITIGVAVTTAGSEGKVDFAGWDVSPDNTRLVYQQLSVTSTGGTVHESSRFFASKTDGTGAAPILNGPPLITSTTGAHLAISPDGTRVAVTNAQGTPTVATGPITGTGGTLVYSPDSVGLPAWLPDSSGFLSARIDQTPQSDIYQYLLSTPPVDGRIPGTEVHTQGTDPATLP